MLTADTNSHSQDPYHLLIDSAWCAGAKAALELVGKHVSQSSWKWREFLQEVDEMIELLGMLKSTDPGTDPDAGSALDSLGGYISVAGMFTHEGLKFAVPNRAFDEKIRQLIGTRLVRSGLDLVLPFEELPRLDRLVPVRGPLSEEVLA